MSQSQEPRLGPSGQKNRGNAGKGRKKGSQNKTPKLVKDMVLEALEQVGGVMYLVMQANENPVAFMALVAKCMPTQVSGELDLNHKRVTVNRVPPSNADN
jgi:hypothetical protein